MSNALIALFIVAHGLVHPIMALAPAPNSDPPVVGGFWTKSWMLGEGTNIKPLIYAGAIVACIVLLFAGLSLMGWIVPQAWWQALIILGTALSLLMLLVFWNNWFIVGVIINVILLVLVLFLRWNPLAGAG